MKTQITDSLLDELLKNYSQPSDLLGPDGLLTDLKKRLINRILDSLVDYLPRLRKAWKPRRRVHRKPTLVPKHQREFNGFDECIVSLYSRGLSVREIQQHLLEIYKVEVSCALITNATDVVVEELKTWQNRTLDPVYPIVYFDAIVVKIRHENKVTNRAIYLALAINLEGKKEVLGMWSSENESARFWLAVATELKNRGLQDLFICCVDGLSGFAQTLEAVYPKCRVQRGIVHQLRNSLKFVNWKERKQIAADLKTIYTAPPRKLLAAPYKPSAPPMMPDTRQSVAVGRRIGISSPPSSTFPRRFGKSSTPPTPSNHSTARFVKSAVTGIYFQAPNRYSSSST